VWDLSILPEEEDDALRMYLATVRKIRHCIAHFALVAMMRSRKACTQSHLDDASSEQLRLSRNETIGLEAF
jgi:hypothetical protein